MELHNEIYYSLTVFLLAALLLLILKWRSFCRQRLEAQIQAQHDERTRSTIDQMIETGTRLNITPDQIRNAGSDDELVDQSIEAQFEPMN